MVTFNSTDFYTWVRILLWQISQQTKAFLSLIKDQGQDSKEETEIPKPSKKEIQNDSSRTSLSRKLPNEIFQSHKTCEHFYELTILKFVQQDIINFALTTD